MPLLGLGPPKKKVCEVGASLSRNLRAISNKIEITSTTIAIHLENSSDLSSGRRPLSKSDECLRWIALVIEI